MTIKGQDFQHFSWQGLKESSFHSPLVPISSRNAHETELVREPHFMIRVQFLLPQMHFSTHLPFFLAGAKGIEPLSAVLETDILPLN